MIRVIQKILEQAVKEQIEKLFTYRNLQAVRDVFVDRVTEYVKNTPSAWDDTAWSVCRRLFDDDNLAELYNWINSNIPVLSAARVCGVESIEFATLKDKLDLTAPNTAAATPWADVVTILRVIIPILIEWYNK